MVLELVNDPPNDIEDDEVVKDEVDNEDGKTGEELIIADDGADNDFDNEGKADAFSPGWILLATSKSETLPGRVEAEGTAAEERNWGSLTSSCWPMAFTSNHCICW